ncbi:hypothetical protein [Mycobacterium sp.]|uniref:LGFP repeat-containing protein n=1 Tax=Mycobacterium sp. TaxID=1785 RepID=UPI00128205C1|nr:hypothetical protein [Mycobacterium sp.]KAA8960448.1 MAG: hypothetical protein F6Q13_13595 [Mycobacterium sp.]
MSSQGLARARGWAALGLVALTTGALLLVPPAAASPQTDAEDAIQAAWEKAGGDTSVLGAKQGEVYAIGDGFAQDFAGGKMFFTPDTGAKYLYGAVLDKYESLGGPDGSTLGFPTMNEVPGLAGPDSRVSTFSASDNPVIFWTPQHGAYVVRGAMNAAWDKLGSSGGVLGVPVGDETYDGEDANQSFSGGKVSWNRVTKVFSTVPAELAQQLRGLQVPIDATAAIDMAWRAAGGPDGPLGAKEGGQKSIGDDAGLVQNFAGGKVFYSYATGANAVEGAILQKYESLGGPQGSDLGFPIANEADGGLPQSRICRFSATDDPVIFWTSKHGAFVVRGAMKAAWDKLGGPTGKLGAPMEDQTVYGEVISQRFTGGKIAWAPAKNSFSTEPPNLASALSGLEVPGQNAPATASQPVGGSGLRQWWWLGVIPVLLLIGAAALIVRRRARGVADSVETPAEEPVPDMVAVPDTGQSWSAEAAAVTAPPQLSEGAADPGEHPELPDRPDTGWRPPVAVAERLAADIPGDAENPDTVDTAPTRVVSEADVRGGRHAAAEADEPVDVAEPRAHPMIHLPLDDPHRAPDGYPVKGNASFGVYYTPDSTLYDEAFAEIWFASEDVARANGFTKG